MKPHCILAGRGLRRRRYRARRPGRRRARCDGRRVARHGPLGVRRWLEHDASTLERSPQSTSRSHRYRLFGDERSRSGEAQTTLGTLSSGSASRTPRSPRPPAIAGFERALSKDSVIRAAPLLAGHLYLARDAAADRSCSSARWPSSRSAIRRTWPSAGFALALALDARALARPRSARRRPRWSCSRAAASAPRWRAPRPTPGSRRTTSHTAHPSVGPHRAFVITRDAYLPRSLRVAQCHSVAPRAATAIGEATGVRPPLIRARPSAAGAQREQRGDQDERGQHARDLADQRRHAEAADREVLADQQRAVADHRRQRAHEHGAAARAQRRDRIGISSCRGGARR